MTTANKITIVRILFVPFFVAQMLYYADTGKEYHRLLALLAFALAAFSDGVDGYIARRYNQKSELGAILDPLADKLLLVSGVVLLTIPSQQPLSKLPLYLALTIVSRDLLLLIGLVVIYYVAGKTKVKPVLAGKIATVLQMACVLWALFKWPPDVLGWLAMGAAVFTGLSGVIYVFQGVRQLSASPSSSPTPRQGD